MGITNFPNGVSSFGIPVIGAGPILTTGSIFFVDSGASEAADDASGHGKDPSSPFKTLDFAVGQCKANNGDFIIVMPGHAEVVSAAGGLDLDVAGITIIGIGDGASQPTVTLDTVVTADIDVDEADITVLNINFVANFADIAICLDVNADDFTVRGCRFTAAAVNMNFKICMEDALATASDRITIEDCYVLQPDAVNTHFINFTGTPDGCIVRNNRMMGDWGTMAIGGAGIVTNILIEGNVINNTATTVDGCINFPATATGMIYANYCASGAAVARGIVAAAMLTAENYHQLVTATLSGLLDPPNV